LSLEPIQTRNLRDYNTTTTTPVVAAFCMKGRFSLDVEGLCGAVPVGATGCCAICWTALVVLLSLVIKGVVD
jgi:hypothetical protein